jgi:hypothetical protein
VVWTLPCLTRESHREAEAGGLRQTGGTMSFGLVEVQEPLSRCQCLQCLADLAVTQPRQR